MVELGDDAGYHWFSQRNPDGSIVFNVNGQVTPSDYGNFDARYQTKSGNMVTGVRLGGVGAYSPPNNTYSWTQNYGNGNVLTGMTVQDTGKNSADNIGGVYYRPLQYCINGAWYTAASV
ncbi:putative IS1 encoded protein [Escherichia coli M056]|uniref:hypothetical protein n=1 Tax=Escherichia coli TaxID=562 RepID=UPI000A184983|nr:putative IS1 encoded protein [Escherichia coli M056]